MSEPMAAELTFGAEVSDWHERINTERMRAYRAQRARMVMRRHGVAALLEASNINRR
jgi:hypothetical protein